MPPDSSETRARLIAAAEQLFADHGIEAVSVREIIKAAGQRNNSALTYHFGSKEGMVAAVLAQHAADVSAQRQAILDSDRTDRRSRMEQLVEAIARPFATKLDGSASDVAYVLIATEVVYTSPTRSYEAAQKLLEDPTIPAITAELAELIDGDEQLVTERIIHGVRFISHAVADRARLQRAKSVRQSRLDLDAFTANLVDMVAASLTAPVSEATARALES